MIFDFDFAVAATAIFVAGLARGTIGFGAALIITPALAIIYGPVEAVLIMTLIEVPATAYLLPTAWRQANWRAVAPLGLASLVTIPLGAWLLVLLDPEILRQIIAVLVLVLGLMLASGWRYARTPSLAVVLAVGAVSGVIGGAANVSGPIIVVFLMAGRNSASEVRAGIMAFFSFATVLRVVLYGWHDLFDAETLWLGAVLAPPYLLAIWIGARFFRGISERLFRWLVVSLVLVMGVVALVQ